MPLKQVVIFLNKKRNTLKNYLKTQTNQGIICLRKKRWLTIYEVRVDLKEG